MKLGTIEIVNEGTRAEPSWAVTSETQGFLIDEESLNAVVAWLYLMIAEGNSYDRLVLDLGTEE